MIHDNKYIFCLCPYSWSRAPKILGSLHLWCARKASFVMLMRWFGKPLGVAQMVKSLPAMQENQVRSLGWKDAWRRKWQPTPIFLPGKSHGRRSLVGYSPWSQRVGYDWTTNTSIFLDVLRLRACCLGNQLRLDSGDFQSSFLPKLWGREKGWSLNQSPVVNYFINHSYVMKPP